MGDDVFHGQTPAERAELAALRARAYSAGGDIAGDPAALARLADLEDAVRRTRWDAAAPAPSPAVLAGPPRPAAVPSGTATAPVVQQPAPSRTPARTRRRGRWITAAVAATLAIATAGVAWTTLETTPDEAGSSNPLIAEWVPATSPYQESDPYQESVDWPSSAEGYLANLDRLRDSALSGSNTEFEHALLRLDVDALLPKGTIEGRSVWVGPTIDGVTCLVLGGDDGPFIGCATSTSIADRGLIVTAPSTPDVTASGSSRVRFTLAADGNVTSEALTTG